MNHRDILAIGTSAGGFQALRFLAGAFPGDLDASVLITIHLASGFQSNLDGILSRDGPLPASFASDGMPLEKRHIYIAPPGRHLLAIDGRLRLGAGPRENNTRPAIDPMLRSVGACCGPRAIGAVLTGTLGDGASGLYALKQCNGITMVQDPNDAAYPEMPRAALRLAKPDHVARLADMPALLQMLLRQPAGKAVSIPEGLTYEIEVARTGQGSMSEMDRIGRRSVLACPDCHGVMWEIDEGDLLRYRCHVGHTYTAELMSLSLDDNLQRALASALRALEERVALAKKLEQEAIKHGANQSAMDWARKVKAFEGELQVMRDSVRRTDEIAAETDLKRAS